MRIDTRDKFKSTIGFIDILFNILIGFAFLFIIAFMLIKPEAKKKDFERRAEFIIILEWDGDAPDDFDLYVEDPKKGMVHFRNPRVNYMHLDKDDLGDRNDTVYNADGSISTVKINREVVTIRGIIPGEYIVNAHYYSDYNTLKANSEKDSMIVKIEVHKVNPYNIIWTGEHVYDRRGAEHTFVRFSINKEGIINSNFSYLKKRQVTPNNIQEVHNSNEGGQQ
jgi:hypothetical protein